MFLKLEHTARPLGDLREVNVWYQEDVKLENVEGSLIRRKVNKLKLRLEFSDGSAWNFDLPDEIDREKFLVDFIKKIEAGKQVVIDVPEVVRELTKEVKR